MSITIEVRADYHKFIFVIWMVLRIKYFDHMITMRYIFTYVSCEDSIPNRHESGMPVTVNACEPL